MGWRFWTLGAVAALFVAIGLGALAFGDTEGRWVGVYAVLFFGGCLAAFLAQAGFGGSAARGAVPGSVRWRGRTMCGLVLRSAGGRQRL